jgi:hypothetical protein
MDWCLKARLFGRDGGVGDVVWVVGAADAFRREGR